MKLLVLVLYQDVNCRLVFYYDVTCVGVVPGCQL